jgi:putative endonuclease
MGRASDAVGAYGERVAANRLVEAGMTVVARNWRYGRGEIDLILRDGPCLVFVEVKTRRSIAYGVPAEAVGPRKQLTLRRLATAYLAQNRLEPAEIRFDLVGVVIPRRGAAQVEHLRNAF